MSACAALVIPSGANAAARQNEHRTCGNTRIDVSFADNIYRVLNDNGDGKIGPRRLVVNQQGRIAPLGTRSFVQSTPMDTSRANLRIAKFGGKARTSVAICATRENGRQTVLSEFDIPRGRSNTRVRRTLTGLRDKRISVRFKGRHPTDTMQYRMFFERPNNGEIWEPTPSQLTSLYRPVQGFVDFHAHHAADWSYARGWYFGDMEGPLAPDPPSHSRQLAFRHKTVPFYVLRPEHAGLDLPVWSDTTHQQMSEAALKEAHDNGLGLMVSQAVNNEWLCSMLSYTRQTDKKYPCHDMESAKLQILKMKRFDRRHDWYRIVTNPWEARDAMYRNQLAVVLGVEVSSLFPTSDGDWKRQLDELYAMGVRQVYIAHEHNNRFAGVSYHHTEALKLPNQLTSLFSPEIQYASEGNGTNAIGLTANGRQLVRELIRRHMLIDVDHVSYNGIDTLARLTRDERFYPVYSGHSRLSDLLTPAHRQVIPEFNTTGTMLNYIRESGGMFGLRTGPEGALSAGGSGVPNDCDGSVKSLAQHYRRAADLGIPVGFGSDINGFVTLTGPRFGVDACPDAAPNVRQAQINAQQPASPVGAPSSWNRYRERGLSDIGALPALIHDMKSFGVDTANIENSGQAFVKMWVRAYDPNRARVP